MVDQAHSERMTWIINLVWVYTNLIFFSSEGERARSEPKIDVSVSSSLFYCACAH